MINFKLSVHRYRQSLEHDYMRKYSFISSRHRDEIEADVLEYATAKQQYKRRLKTGDFNPFTDDPNCKTCRKQKVSINDSRNVNVQPSQNYVFVPRTTKED